MERVIKLSDLREAVNEAYEKFKSVKEGNVDERVKGVDEDLFGITVALADGTVINKGDTDTAFVMGQISKVPVSTLRAEQKAAEMAAKGDAASCNCHEKAHGVKAAKPTIPFGAKGIRAISKLEPKGDPDSKWNFIEDRMTSLIGTAPQLDVKLYEKLQAEFMDANAAQVIDQSDFKLADDTRQSINLFLKSVSMTATTQQLAEMGATIVADGVNPFTRQIVYDGVFSQRVVARMALKSHKLRRFIMKTGLPASAGFGGGVVGVLPGVLSIAAYSPRLCENGVSIKGARAIAYIMKKLNLNVFSSAKVTIES